LIRVRAFDGELYSEWDRSDNTFIIDNTAPTVDITNPIDGSYVMEIVWINATTVEANPYEYALAINETIAQTGTEQVSWQWVTYKYVDGVFIITVTDAAGNVGYDTVTGRQLIREPEPIPANRFVIIPDFCFKKGGMKVYMEVVGFWTQDYLKRKIEKLRMLESVDMIVAVDRELACQKIDRVREKLDVIYYKAEIPLTPVLSHLKAVENDLKKKQVQLLRETPLNLTESVVDMSEITERLGVMEETVREILSARATTFSCITADAKKRP